SETAARNRGRSRSRRPLRSGPRMAASLGWTKRSSASALSLENSPSSRVAFPVASRGGSKCCSARPRLPSAVAAARRATGLDMHLGAALATGGQRKELLGPCQILHRMDPWLGEQGQEVRVAGQPGEDRRAGFRAGFLGLPLGSSLGRKGRKRHEELKIGVLEPQDVAAGFTRIAGRAVAAARVAEQRAREIERRPSLPA